MNPMNEPKAHLIIPVENQVRELDAKLLLACVAADRGFSAVIGSRLEVDFRIASFPESFYLSKSMTARSVRMFRIMERLGHVVAAWDEEALVHPPPEAYYSRRLSPVAIRYVSLLFSWGRDNTRLWRGYPHLPGDVPIHVTGNPRGDMLRPEMLGYFSKEADALRDAYGDFLLINTNFSNVNAFYPGQNLFLPGTRPGEPARFGRGALGMSRAFAEGLRDHKQAVFESFKEVIPALEAAFPRLRIVVRPHPVENPEVYHRIASRCRRVAVLNRGNVVPWLMAARAVVHNGCTTGIEAYIMGVPAVSYQAAGLREYDNGFYRLPNALSHQCFDFDELAETLKKIVSGELGAAGGEARRALMDRYLAAREGPLACRRIVDVIEAIVDGGGGPERTALKNRLIGRGLAARRRGVKWCRSFLPGSKYRPEFQRHRYPGISLSALRERISRFRELSGMDAEIVADPLPGGIYRIHRP